MEICVDNNSNNNTKTTVIITNAYVMKKLYPHHKIRRPHKFHYLQSNDILTITMAMTFTQSMQFTGNCDITLTEFQPLSHLLMLYTIHNNVVTMPGSTAHSHNTKS